MAPLWWMTAAFALLVGGCSPGAPGECTVPVANSVPGLTADGRIRSHPFCSTYGANLAVRRDGNGADVSIDYMVHDPTSAPTALVVLIPGGDGDARIEGADGIGQPATRSSGNFLVRSAHLFGAEGLRVVTIDRPSDFSSVLASSDYDVYRTSVAHAVDLSTLINAENPSGLPVMIAGTSRGAISAVAQSALADAVSLSSPVTSGAGTPVVEGTSVSPSSVAVPVHVLWHVDDACGVSTPLGSSGLLVDLTMGSAAGLSGGFNADDFGVCNGNSFHGFYGMEVAAVSAITDWIDGLAFPSSKPLAAPGELDYAMATTTGVDLSGLAAASAGGGLTFALPFAQTIHGATVTLSGSSLDYADPGLASGTVDRFVYIVSEAGGGKGHNVLSITIP